MSDLPPRVDSEQRIRGELRGLLQDRLLKESGLALFGHPVLIGFVVFLSWGQAPHAMLAGWASAVVLATAFRWGWLRTVPHRRLGARDAQQGVRLTVTLLGLCWGVGAALVLPLLPLTYATLVLTVLAGIVAGAVATLPADPPSFYGLLTTIALGALAGVLTGGHDRPHLVAAGIVAFFGGVMVRVQGRAHEALLDHLRVTALLAVREDAARRAEEAMREARNVAERAARGRSAFLANMSHEIRTPMNAVLGFVELVLDTELTTEQRRALELVRASSEALLTILNDVLDYSKIEAEHLDLESIPFDLPKVVYATVSLLAVRAREKHLELVADVAAQVPRTVQGDPTRLRQILTNLIGNAIKFTDEGEVVVTVAATASDGGRAHVRFSVRDTGIGISGEQVGAIFQEFTQGDASTTRRYGGTGLGLAISRRLVALMGGELTVASTVGRGSEFAFTVPFPVQAEPPGVLATSAISLGGRRVLIVDDNETNRRLLRNTLAGEGMAVAEAGSAAAGLEAVRGGVRQQAPYDLVVLDAQMPERDGFELAAQIRADPALGAARLLMLTSAGRRGDGERCRELGIQAYLTKPIGRSDLIEAVSVVLGAPAAQVPAVITRHTIAESRRALRVLLAEDNRVNQQVAVALLLKRGHLVDVAATGREAVAAFRQRPYDVVLMDIQMPEMDGFEATAAIRALPAGGAVPIIALTAHALSGERERCLAHGMTGYLAKPFKPQELYAIVEERSEPPPPPQADHGAVPVDVEAFRRTMRDAGAEAAVDAILDTFRSASPDRVNALEAAAAASDIGRRAQEAHAFRGAASTLGARALAALLETIETSARAGDLEAARAATAHVRAAAEAVLTRLRG